MNFFSRIWYQLVHRFYTEDPGIFVRIKRLNYGPEDETIFHMDPENSPLGATSLTLHDSTGTPVMTITYRRA